MRSASRHEVLIIGLDTLRTAAEQLGRIGGDAARVQAQGDIDAQRELIDQHADLVVKGDLIECTAAVDAAIRVLRNRGGLVDRGTMLSLLRAGTLLNPYDEGCTQTASYDLRLGDQLLFDGNLVQLTAQNPAFSIPPYSFIIAASLEQADLPKFFTGRFDLRVSNFLKGIILSNGPQVDPGFRGGLFCMLYNASDHPVPIKRTEHFATIEFHTTALVAATERPTAYHAFANPQQLNAEILGRPGSKLLARIDAVTPKVSKVLSGWTATFSLISVALAVAVGWALTTLTDAQKTLAEVKRQLDDAKDVTRKTETERSALMAEGAKVLSGLEAQAKRANEVAEELQAIRERRKRQP